MGIDYCWAGSSSYGRFTNEREEIAKVLGAKSRKTPQGELYFKYYENIPDIVVGWLNNPYEYYLPWQTKEIWEEIRQHPEIEEISPQIWEELKLSVEFNSGWMIH